MHIFPKGTCKPFGPVHKTDVLISLVLLQWRAAPRNHIFNVEIATHESCLRCDNNANICCSEHFPSVRVRIGIISLLDNRPLSDDRSSFIWKKEVKTAKMGSSHRKITESY